MNIIYKIMWSSVKRQWVVVSELVKKGKAKSVKLAVVAALSSIPSLAMAYCVNSPGRGIVANENSTCDNFFPDHATNTDPNNNQLFNDDVIVVNTGATVNHSGDLKITNTGSHTAMIVGSPDDLTTALATVNIDGNLTINTNANLNATRSDVFPSGILLGDASELNINGNLNITQTDNHDPNWGKGAPIRVWNKQVNNSTMTVKGTTTIISNGEGIRNGEEHPDPLMHKGGRLTFEDLVTIDAKSVGLKNNAGTILFDKGIEIKSRDGIGLIQTQNGGSITANGNLSLRADGWHNNMIIKGGELTVNGDANIITTGSGKGAGQVGFDESQASSSAIYVDQSNPSAESKIRFKGSNLTASTESSTGLNQYGIGDVIKMRGGYLALAKNNYLTAKGSGNGITLSDGTITAADNNSETLNITTDEGKAIYMTGGLLHLNKTEISKNSFDTNDDSTRNTIEVAGGKLVVSDSIKVSKSQDSTLIHSTVTSNQTADFSTTSSGNIDLSSNNPSGEIIEDIIHHDGAGTLNVENNGQLIARQHLFKNTSTGKINVSNNTGAVLSGKIDSGGSVIDLNNTGTWEITADSKLTNVTNAGTIVFKHPLATTRSNDPFFKLIITGDYAGNGSIKMHTVWNAPGDEQGRHSDSDVLNIAGKATGNTTIIPVSANGNENVIDGDIQQVNKVINTIPVVTVAQGGGANAFTGSAQTTGATQVQLAKRTVNGVDEYFWSMEAFDNNGGGTGGGSGGGTGGGSGGGTGGGSGGGTGGGSGGGSGGGTGGGSGGGTGGGSGGGTGGGSGGGTGGGSGNNKGTLIYADAVAGYTVMPRVNLEQGFTSLGTLRERRGNVTCVECFTSDNRHTWARAFGKHQKQDGKLRLNLDTDIYGVQIGHDFWVKQTANNGLNMLGAYLAYSHAATDFSDQYHARNGLIIADKKTGKGKSDSISLGLTNTYYGYNGSYLDLVGQLSYLHNKYTANTGKNPDSQDGWGAAVSAEVGRTLPLRESNWSVTPQAQLVYQFVDLDSFHDGIRHVDQNNQDALRGRVGLRLEYNAAGQAGKTASFYTVGNIWHDFINPSHVSIGRDSIREKFNTTWGEIGVGLQLPLARHSQLYGDVRYEHNFGSSKHQSFRGNIGFKVNW